MPLQVYLDSSDYSVLSDAMLDIHHPAFSLFESLCNYVTQGSIEIRFSAVHVIEIAHLDAVSKQFALRRAHCLTRLSAGKCFQFLLDMRVTEVANILSRRPVYTDILQNNSAWFPDLSPLALSLRQRLIDEFKMIAHTRNVSRQQRRAFERRYFHGGYLTNEAIQALQPGREALLRQLSEQFPLSERFWRDDLMLRFAAGKVAAKEIVHELSVVFRDVEIFIGWAYDTRDPDRQFVSWLRDYGRDLAAAIELVQMQMESLLSFYTDFSTIKGGLLRQLDEKIREMRQSVLADIRARIQHARLDRGLSRADWKAVENLTFGAIPSLDAQLASVREYFMRNAQIRRKPKASDAGDLFHLVHLPYCHVFRADGETAEIAKPLAAAYKTRVVSKLRDLPDVIERMLPNSDAGA